MRRATQGFTLIEVITVIVLVGILAPMTIEVISQPVRGYFDMQRRTTLVDNAETALRLMQRDIRRAVPNSIRLANSGGTLELLHSSSGGRYRAKLASDGSGNILDFTSADSSFDIIGSLQSAPQGQLVIYNLGNGITDAYAGNNRASIANSSTISRIDLSAAKLFPLQSPQQRFFIVDTPITYRCSNGNLLRYDGYSITSSQADPPSGVTGQLLANKASSCSFSYNSSSASRSGLVTLRLTLTDDSGDSSQLIHQIHVDNAP